MLTKSLSLFLLISSFMFVSDTQSKRKKHFNIENGVALQGYDPVAYFKQGKAVKGDKKFAVNAEGILYYCSNAENQSLMLKNYSSYEPQYGGWCAYAMGSSGNKVEIDPETFKIVDQHLYLFYNAYFNNTLKSWNKDEKNLKMKADLNWKKILTD